MKKSILAIILLLICQTIFAQTFIDLKVKSKSNSVERTYLLTLIKKSLKREFKQDFTLVVNKLHVYKNYAWFKGDVQRIDGKAIVFNDSEGFYDCCHAEYLFQKKSGKWIIIEQSPFSTDFIWDEIWSKYKLPRNFLIED